VIAMRNCRISETECRLERETTTPSGRVTMRHIIGTDGRLEIPDAYHSRELLHTWERAEGETLEAFKTRVVCEAESAAAGRSRRVGISPLHD
jgi:hypothetical protein